MPGEPWRELQTFGGIETRCELAFHNQLWFLAVGLPRIVIGLPALLLFAADDTAETILRNNGPYLDLLIVALIRRAILHWRLRYMLTHSPS